MTDKTERSSLIENQRPQMRYTGTQSQQSRPAISFYGNINKRKPNTKQFKPFSKRTGSYDEDRHDLMKENTGVRVWSESYSSIDWIHDRIKEGLRKKKLQSIPGIRGRLLQAMDASQAWILVVLVGAIVAAIAWFIDVVQEWMTGLKQGFCTTNWRLNEDFCCWENKEGDSCDAWKTWPQVFGVQDEDSVYYTGFAVYTLFGLIFSFIAAVMVKYTAEKVKVRTTPISQMPFSISPSMASVQESFIEFPPIDKGGKDQEYEIKDAFYSAGSGIPEVKVILGGFVIKGFLGIKTLLVKSVGMVFSTSAGLTCGKEGPFVHLACSAGNVACRLFPKFNKNESKKREILSAAASAGVAVAFGAPIGGVLFSLEEVSYYFPMKTMIRSYCCAMVAAIVLKIMDPFGTGKIVLFQVSYDKEYHLFELVPLIMCGAFAGLFGASVTFFNIKFQQFRRSTVLGKYPVIEVLGIMLLTAIVSYWNPFARLGLSEFAAHLFSECSPTDDNGGLCAKTAAEIPQLLYLLLTTLVIKMILTVITFGCAVPGGVFLPSLIIGAVTGRFIGLIMQYLTLTFPDAWPFTACAQDFATRGECVIPGVYAMVGAAAGLAGVTRTTLSLVVIMFELTYSLTYALPIMMAVMMAKWVADAMFIEGIYDLLIELKQYPYLESAREYVHTMTITTITENPSTIEVEEPITVNDLKNKIATLEKKGYAEDGGFPIISDRHVLEGYIATSEVIYGLEQLKKKHCNPEHPEALTDDDFGNIECYFNGEAYSAYCTNANNSRLSSRRPSTTFTSEDNFKVPFKSLMRQVTNEETGEDRLSTSGHSLKDFSQYIDHAPLTINQNASMTLLMDMFTKLGARYVCVTSSNGRYVGIIHKRRLLAYLKGLEEE